jgi:hypothetical protein
MSQLVFRHLGGVRLFPFLGPTRPSASSASARRPPRPPGGLRSQPLCSSASPARALPGRLFGPLLGVEDQPALRRFSAR